MILKEADRGRKEEFLKESTAKDSHGRNLLIMWMTHEIMNNREKKYGV